MTTPAVNIDELSKSPGTMSIDDGVPVVIGQYWDRRHVDKRPASTSVPFDQNGWRNCRSWSHQGCLWTRGHEIVHRYVRFNPYPERDYTFAGGSFWNINVPGLAPSFSTNLKNRVITKALLKLKNVDIHIGVAVAEIQRTMNMVGSNSAAIARQTRRYRGTYPKDWNLIKRWQLGRLPRRLWNRIPSRWLELQYGWIPLMNDIVGAANYLSREVRPRTVHVRAFSEDSDKIHRLYTASAGGSKVTLEFLTHQRCWVSLYYEMTNPQLADASSLGLVQPCEVVWEMLPYSFVVDWFLPIGSWLQSQSADAGFTFKGGSLSQKSSLFGARTSNVEWEDFQNASTSFRAIGSLPIVNGKAESFVRTCLDSSPVPGVYVKNPLSPKHMLNGLALLRQAFS